MGIVDNKKYRHNLTEVKMICSLNDIWPILQKQIYQCEWEQSTQLNPMTADF